MYSMPYKIIANYIVVWTPLEAFFPKVFALKIMVVEEDFTTSILTGYTIQSEYTDRVYNTVRVY